MRFSLRTLVILSLLIGAAGMLWRVCTRDLWRIDGRLEMTQSEGEAGRHFVWFESGQPVYEFDFRGRGLWMASKEELKVRRPHIDLPMAGVVRGQGNMPEMPGPDDVIEYPSIAFSPKMDAVLLGNNSRVSLHELHARRQRFDCEIQAKNVLVSSGKYVLPLLAFSLDEKTVAALTPVQQTLYIIDAQTGKVRHKIDILSDKITELRYSTDGKKLAIVNFDEAIVCDVTTGKLRFGLSTASLELTAFYNQDELETRTRALAAEVAQTKQHDLSVVAELKNSFGKPEPPPTPASARLASIFGTLEKAPPVTTPRLTQAARATEAIFVEGAKAPWLARSYVLRRFPPLGWWGPAYTIEFWVAGALFCALVWSVRRDRRELRRTRAA